MLQAGGLPSSLERDIEAAERGAQTSHPVGPSAVPNGSTSVGGSAVTEPLQPPPIPQPPPPPPGPDVFGLTIVPEKLTLLDNRWIRVGTLPSRGPLLAELIKGASNMTAYQQASYIQQTVNRRLAYKTDQDNWGVSDYWASADETMARGAGDCEDFALVKMQALRLLGFNERDLYLMVGTRASGEDHALLLVRIDGRFWVLEDGLDRMVRAEAFNNFRPAVSYGAGWKWTHGTQSADRSNRPLPAQSSLIQPR
jgi:predicted transglutaminase-like cysteine proteinase